MSRRIYERDTDELFARHLRSNPTFAAAFVQAILPGRGSTVTHVRQQAPHRGTGHTGTIDLEITLSCGARLLVENKIDAAYSVTRMGDPQPARYAASVAALRAVGGEAVSVLLGPQLYLSGSRHTDAFDRTLAYEALRGGLDGSDRHLIEDAIRQAETPYEPEPNTSSAAFFASYRAFAARHTPELAIRREPNGGGVRPTGSHTVYFDVPRTLRAWPGPVRPRMSLQCWDSGAASASVKIMLGGLAGLAGRLRCPGGLSDIGGYLRAAGGSLGLVVDTPRLDTQRSFDAQVTDVEAGLQAARALAQWWNSEGGSLEAAMGRGQQRGR